MIMIYATKQRAQSFYLIPHWAWILSDLIWHMICYWKNQILFNRNIKEKEYDFSAHQSHLLCILKFMLFFRVFWHQSGMTEWQSKYYCMNRYIYLRNLRKIDSSFCVEDITYLQHTKYSKVGFTDPQICCWLAKMRWVGGECLALICRNRKRYNKSYR